MRSDEKLLLLLQKSPDNGLEKLMNRYMGSVYAIIYSKLSNSNSKEDIEECVSDVFYELYKNRNSIDLQKGSIKAYLSVIAKRRAIDMFRKYKSSLANISIDETEYDNIPSEPSEISERETRDILIKEIKTLGKPDSEIFIRKFYYGQSTRLIAKALHLKENTVDKKVSRGLDKLKQSFGGVL